MSMVDRLPMLFFPWIAPIVARGGCAPCMIRSRAWRTNQKAFQCQNDFTPFWDKIGYQYCVQHYRLLDTALIRCFDPRPGKNQKVPERDGEMIPGSRSPGTVDNGMLRENRSMVHVAVVEDEAKDRELLTGYLQQFAKDQQLEIKITAFSDGIGIISPYRGGYDIIFLDIQMGYVDGLTAAQKIREKDENVILIFITNLAQYAIKGYSVGATNFLLKPVTYFAFSEELKNALVKLGKKQKTTVLLHSDEETIRINIADILFAETVGRSLVLHTHQGEYRLNDTLANLEVKFADPRFFRCHRGYLVNLYCVERVRNNDILIHQTVIPLSRYKRQEFEDALIKVMGEAI